MCQRLGEMHTYWHKAFGRSTPHTLHYKYATLPFNTVDNYYCIIMVDCTLVIRDLRSARIWTTSMSACSDSDMLWHLINCHIIIIIIDASWKLWTTVLRTLYQHHYCCVAQLWINSVIGKYQPVNCWWWNILSEPMLVLGAVFFVRIDPIRFLAGCRKQRLNQG